MTRNTVSVTFNDEDYETLKDLADEEDRTMDSQARHMLRGLLGVVPGCRLTGVIVPDDMVGNGDDIHDNTSRGPTDTDAAEQEPLPG